MLWLATEHASAVNITVTLVNAGTTNLGSGAVGISSAQTGPYSWSDTSPSAVPAGGYGTKDFSIADGWWLLGGDTLMGSRTEVQGPAVQVHGSGNYTVVVYANGTNTCIAFPATVRNTSAGNVAAVWMLNGTVMWTQSLYPGQSYTYTYPCVNITSDTLMWGYSSYPVSFGTDDHGNPIVTAPPGGLGGTTGSGGQTITNGSGSTLPPYETNGSVLPAQLITNSPINWGIISNQNSQVDAAGFSLLHGDNQQILQALNAQLQTMQIGNNINSNGFWFDGMWIQTNTAKVVEAITNNPPTAGGTSSNVWVMNFPTNQPLGNVSDTNLYALLQGHWGSLSNTFATNDYQLTNAGVAPSYVMSDSDTNDTAATAQAESDISGPLESADANIAGMSALNQTVPDDGNIDWTLTFGAGTYAQTVDLNPVSHFPWAFALSHAFYTWVLYIIFITGVVDTLYRVLSDYAAAQTSRVPPMQGGRYTQA